MLAVGGEPGRAYEVSPWESYFAAMPAFRDERWDEAIAMIEDGPARAPGHPSILYNLACAESLPAGRSTRSRTCRQAIAADSEVRGPGPRGPGLRPDPPRARLSRLDRVARKPDALRPARGSAGTGSASGRATSSTAPKPSSGVSASTSSWSPTASANALWACSPPNGARSSSARAAGEHVAVGEVPHRDVGDDRAAVGRRDRDRERVRPGQLRPAVGMAEPARRGRGERGDEAAFGERRAQ